jgi:predicted amidophosphoribosyltransferase
MNPEATVAVLARPCPDCGSPWPPSEDRCPGCLLHVEDLRAAAELLDRLERKNP